MGGTKKEDDMDLEDCKDELLDQKEAGCGTMRSWETDEECEVDMCDKFLKKRKAFIKKHSKKKIKTKKAKSKKISALAKKLENKLNPKKTTSTPKKTTSTATSKRTTTEVLHCSGPGDCTSKKAIENRSICLSTNLNSNGLTQCKWKGPNPRQGVLVPKPVPQLKKGGRKRKSRKKSRKKKRRKKKKKSRRRKRR